MAEKDTRWPWWTSSRKCPLNGPLQGMNREGFFATPANDRNRRCMSISKPAPPPRPADLADAASRPTWARRAARLYGHDSALGNLCKMPSYEALLLGFRFIGTKCGF